MNDYPEIERAENLTHALKTKISIFIHNNTRQNKPKDSNACNCPNGQVCRGNTDGDCGVQEEKEVGDKCCWVDVGEYEDNYETGCGNLFDFADGGPEHNSFKHCPFCGKEIQAIKEEG